MPLKLSFLTFIWYTDHSNGWKCHTSSSTDHGICGRASELHNSYYCKNGLTNIVVYCVHVCVCVCVCVKYYKPSCSPTHFPSY